MEVSTPSPTTNTGVPQAYTVGLWIDDFSKPDNQESRLKSLKNLTLIAKHLNPEEVREDLMVFLHQLIDEDEVIALTLAQELGKLFPYVGGSQHVENLILLLESLAGTEEAMVRDTALDSILYLLEQTEDKDLAVYKEVTVRLAKSDWFACRASSVSLFSGLYERVSEEDFRNLLVSLYETLGSDSKPLVRRAVGSKLRAWTTVGGRKVNGFVDVVNINTMTKVLLPLFMSLSEDGQDSVRFLAGASGAAINRRITKQQNEKYGVTKRIFDLIQDPSWRVRYAMAEVIIDIQDSERLQGNESASEKVVVKKYENLLTDTSSEVRCISAKHITKFCENLNESIRQDIMFNRMIPIVNDLVDDSSQLVRLALVPNLFGLGKLIGKENTLKLLLPATKNLLADDFPEIRITCIANMQCLVDVLGASEVCEAITEAIAELAEDRQWRVRLAAIEYSPMLAKILGSSIEDHLSNFCMTWLVDSVSSVRGAAADSIKELALVYGNSWVFDKLFPRLVLLKDHPNYLYRMTLLFTMNSLLAILDGNDIVTIIIPLLKDLSSDPVANVRLNVAKTCGLIAKTLNNMGGKGTNHDAVEKMLQPLLDEFAVDEDIDVKNFANQAMVFVNN